LYGLFKIIKLKLILHIDNILYPHQEGDGTL